MVSIPIGIKGRIRNEGVSEPYILVEDEVLSTGGYYVFQYPSSDFVGGFDDWVLASELEDYFRDSGWEVDWMEGNQPEWVDHQNQGEKRP